MNDTLDMDRIANALGAARRGKVTSRGGYFGALQLAAEVRARFRTTNGGGCAPDTDCLHPPSSPNGVNRCPGSQYVFRAATDTTSRSG